MEESFKPCRPEASVTTTEEEKEEEKYSKKHDTPVVEDLKLGNYESSMNQETPSSKFHALLNSPSKSKTSMSKEFSCRFCTRGFSTLQALGGHQSVHTQERKRRNPKALTAVRAESLIQKPSSYSSLSSHGSKGISSSTVDDGINPNPNPTIIDDAVNREAIKIEEGGAYNNHQRLRLGDVDDGEDIQHDAEELDLELRL